MDIRRKDDAQSGGNQTAPAGNSSGGVSGVVGTVIVLLVLAGLVLLGLYLADGEGVMSDDGTDQIEDGPVAVVNGEEIDGEQLSEQLQAFRNSTSTQAQQFQNLSESRQIEILLEGIINTELQLQAAQEAGVTVSDQEVENQLQSRIGQIGTSTFEQRLEQNDVTRTEVKEDLRNQMIINAYIQQEAGGEITATDQEVQQLYQQYSTQIQQSSGTSSAQVPELAQLRPQIEAAVIQQKQQRIATQLLEQARSNAEIEILIDGVSYPTTTSTAPATPPQAPQAGSGTSSDVVPAQ